MRKINLGCGRRKIEGYINVDCRSEVNPDVVGDIKSLPFKDESFDEVYSHSVLEHFSKWELRDLLKEWSRILKSGGAIVISVPDMKKIAEDLSKSNSKVEEYQLINLIYGEQDYKENAHKFGYTEGSLIEFLKEVGFITFDRLPSERYKQELFIKAIKK